MSTTTLFSCILIFIFAIMTLPTNVIATGSGSDASIVHDETGPSSDATLFEIKSPGRVAHIVDRHFTVVWAIKNPKGPCDRSDTFTLSIDLVHLKSQTPVIGWTARVPRNCPMKLQLFMGTDVTGYDQDKFFLAFAEVDSSAENDEQALKYMGISHTFTIEDKKKSTAYMDSVMSLAERLRVLKAAQASEEDDPVENDE